MKSELGEALKEQELTIRSLLEAGVHYGHQPGRWNPLMRSYIFGERNGTHIIDLDQTLPLLRMHSTSFARRRLPEARSSSWERSAKPRARS